MLISEIISELRKDTPWVNYDKTRDVYLVKNDDLDVDKIGVCWTASMQVLNRAVEEGIHLIISHENFLYVEGTMLYKGYIEARERKIALCKEHNITVYRFHDGWDVFPEYGINDMLCKVIDLTFEKREPLSFYSYANVDNMPVKEVAQKIARALAPYGSDHVEVLGNVDKQVHRVCIGTGAILDLPSMMKGEPDCLVLADDGSCNWIEHHWCLDNDIAVILYHHSVNEMPGIDGMKQYLDKKFRDIETLRLKEGFVYTSAK